MATAHTHSPYSRLLNDRNGRFVVRIILIGPRKVGKTSLVGYFLNENCDVDTLYHTKAFNFKVTTISVDGIAVHLQLWDSFTPELHHTPSQEYFDRTHAILLVYDKTDKFTFDHVLPMWVESILKYSSSESLKLLIGNKADVSDISSVSYSKARMFAMEHGFDCIETSAKTGYNVEQAIIYAVTQAKQKLLDIAGDHLKPMTTIIRGDVSPLYNFLNCD